MEIFAFKNQARYKKVVKCFYYSFEKFFYVNQTKFSVPKSFAFSVKSETRGTGTNTAVGYNKVFSKFGFQILQTGLRNEIYSLAHLTKEQFYISTVYIF